MPIIKKFGGFCLEDYALGTMSFKDIKNFAALSGIQNLYPSLNKDFIVEILDDKLNKAFLIKNYPYENSQNFKEIFKIISKAILEKF